VVAALASTGGFALAWLDANAAVYAAELPAGLDLQAPIRVVRGPATRAQARPSVAPYGDVFAVAFDYADGNDADFVVVDPRDLEPTRAEEAGLHSRLTAVSNQSQIALVATPAGLWVSWVDDGLTYNDGARQLAAGFLPAP
jgi:hypothetical protein